MGLGATIEKTPRQFLPNQKFKPYIHVLIKTFLFVFSLFWLLTNTNNINNTNTKKRMLRNININ